LYPDPAECEKNKEMAKRKKFDVRKEVRKLARERIGTVQPARPIDEKPSRRKPKHKKPVDPEDDV
jgi:hypothetical protein